MGRVDLRVVLSPEEYRALSVKKYVLQEGRCARCGKVKPLQLHHKHGRGIGGGKRNDEDSELCCQKCHDAADKKG